MILVDEGRLDLETAYRRLHQPPASMLYSNTLQVLAGALVSVQLLAEMRQLEDRLGLTPMARRRLQWELPAEAAEPEKASGRSDELAARRERFARAVS